MEWENLFIFYKHEGSLNLYTWYWQKKKDSMPESITVTQLSSISVTVADYTVWNF